MKGKIERGRQKKRTGTGAESRESGGAGVTKEVRLPKTAGKVLCEVDTIIKDK